MSPKRLFCDDTTCLFCTAAPAPPWNEADGVPMTKAQGLYRGHQALLHKQQQVAVLPVEGNIIFPLADGTNGLMVCRMSKETSGVERPFAPLRVVDSLVDVDLRMAKAGWNLVGQVVSLAGLDEKTRVGFCELANKSITKRNKLGLQFRQLENDIWGQLPRLTGPGMDIDTRNDLKGTEQGRMASLRLAEKLIEAEEQQGVGIRASWSGGEEAGRIHLDWVWDGSLAEPYLLQALEHRVIEMCAKLGVPTSDSATPDDDAWVDLVPLHHGTANRGRLWRPVGGLRESGARKVPMAGIQGGSPLTASTIQVHIDHVITRAQEELLEQSQRRRRRQGSRKTREEPWLVPSRREDLEPLRAFLQTTSPDDGPKRHEHRMAWAEALRAAGFRDRDTAWIISSSHGNVEDSEKLVENTRQRHEEIGRAHV